MAESAFGVEHGEISKGLPRAVANGGGGHYGGLLRQKKNMGAIGAKYSNSRRITVPAGQQVKQGVEAEASSARVDQIIQNKGARQLRAGLLNEDSAARRNGYKTGKSSALDRHYRGRVSSKMTKLP